MSIASEDTPLDDDNDSNADVVMQLPLVVNNNNTDAVENNNSKEEMVSLSLCKLSPTRRLVLLKPELFLRKVVLVFVASYALLPLLAYKNSLPGALYVSLLILIHVGVLFLYLYRVTFQDLDVDRLSLGGRILGLVVVTWLLTVVSGWQDRTHVGILAIQMLVLCLVHTVMLALLMVAVVEKEEEE